MSKLHILKAQCGNCRSNLQVKTHSLTKIVICPKCSNSVTVSLTPLTAVTLEVPIPESVVTTPKPTQSSSESEQPRRVARSCPQCGQLASLFRADLFTGFCKKCQVAYIKNNKEQEKLKEQRHEIQNRLISSWTPERAVQEGACAVKDSLVNVAGMDEDNAQKIADSLFPRKDELPKKPVSKRYAREMPQLEADYFIARMVLGFFCLVFQFLLYLQFNIKLAICRVALKLTKPEKVFYI